MRLGTAWYPEQWDEARWPEDLRLMKAAGISMVRVAEFAWSRLEPRDGAFDLDWLDRAITLAGQAGIVTVIGTPSAAPPAWLTARHPEILRVKEDGSRDTHGNRQHVSFTHPVFRRYARRIAERLAQRFGRSPYVIAWQIDNEYGAESADQLTHGLFQNWLRKRYGSLDTLNRRWVTSYWSQTYDRWDEIPIPLGAGHNPSLKLDWRRFVTDTWRDYQRNQTEVVRRHSRAPITHNYVGWADAFDHYTVSADLDFASWDAYKPRGHLNAGYALHHDLVRGLLGKAFWVMETQPAFVNWSDVNSGLARGEVRTMAWQAIAHGADLVAYWQWRSALGGQEQYHGTLIAPDGAPRPVFSEIALLGGELARARDALAGTQPVAEVAFLNSYEDRWAINFQRHHRQFDYIGHLGAYYRAVRGHVTAVDVVRPDAELGRYKVVWAPSLHLLDGAVADKLRGWVERGGHLILGARSGLKSPDNTLLPERQPGPLARALGAHVDEFYALDAPVPLTVTEPAVASARGKDAPGTKGPETDIWGELITVDAPDATPLLRYGKANGWLDGTVAAVTRPVGKGRLTYVGAWPDDRTLGALAGWALQVGGVAPSAATAPEGVELATRSGGGKELLFAISHLDTPAAVELPAAAPDLLAGGPPARTHKLAPRGVALLRVR